MYARLLGLIALSLYLPSAAAYWTGQDLTEAEWAAWPDYCRAAYLSADWANNSPFNGRLSQSARTEILKTNTIYGAHHFCIALVAMNRSKGKPANKARELMKLAASEIDFCRVRMEKSDRQYHFVAAHFAKALFGSGERSRAMTIWDEAIEAKPAEREAYLMKAEALVSEKRLDDALQLVLRFDQNKTQEWPDAEYFLGYLYYQLRRYDDAKRHLDKAHELGYPYSGLREKVAKMTK